MSQPHSPTAPCAAPALLDLVLAAADRTLQAVRTLRDNWRRDCEVSDTHLALQQLDDRTLRDLGIHRSELWSLAAETHGDLHTTRALAARSVRGLHF